MTDLFLDLETSNTVPLRHGTYIYTATAKIIITAWAVDDGPVHVEEGLPGPAFFQFYNNPAVTKIAHNSMFDRTVMAANDMPTPVEQWQDTMVQALCHGLPGGLDPLCELFKIPQELAKKKFGRALIQIFCVPRKDNGKFNDKNSHPVEWQRFLDYAGADILAMRALRKKLPKWNYPNGPELARWHLDQRINDRGFAVDTELATQCVRACDAAKKRHADNIHELTGGEVERATQRDRLLGHILEWYGVELPDLTQATLTARLEDQDLPWQVRELIAIRLQSAQASVAKYKTLLKAVSADGRIRGSLQFSGAQRTGRWAGRVLQPQNLPRPSMKQPEIEAFIAAVKAMCEELIYD